jgi:hypothetical protein
MASAFDKLRDRASQMKKLANKIDTDKNSYDDNRFWKLTVDKKQTGSAIIRFLPAVDGEDFPYIKMYTHGFEWPHRGSGQWFVENCPTTIEREDCPCCAANNEEWQKGTEAAKNVARERKRNLAYIANIYVVDDPAKPENNGKNFLYSFGARIFQKIEGALKPEFADITPINPFDFWEGANFKLRARELDGQRSYDMSVFESQAPLAADDKMEAIWKAAYPLQPEVAPSKFKSPEDLLAKWNKVMNIKTAGAPVGAGTTGSFQRRSEGGAPNSPAPAPRQAPAAQPPAGPPDAPWLVDGDDIPDSGMASAPKSSAPPPPAPAPTLPAPKAPAAAGQSLADKYRSMLNKQ